jgi:tape measure domain-containing protein
MATRETTVKLTVADNFSAQLRAFSKALDQSEKSVTQTSKKMSVFGEANAQLASGIKGGINMALASMPMVMVAAGAAALKLGMDMEQTRVAFTSLTGSAELANAHLEELRKFAASTPFQFTELTAASKKMMAFGFAAKDVIPMMTDIGDAVSALGAGSQGIDSVVRALGQMTAKGKVSAEEMNQLTEVGINGWKYLAQGMNKTTAEVMALSQKGLIPAGKAVDYLLKGMREDFGGGMAAQSKTAAGQLSNLVDSLVEVGSTIGEIMLPALKQVITKLGEFANTLKEGVRTADLLINWNKKLTEAFVGTEKQIRSNAKSYEEYKSATEAVAKNAGLMYEQYVLGEGMITKYNEGMILLTEQEWAADRALQSRNATTAAYVSTLGARMASEQAATAALAAQSAIMSPAELGMLALAEASRETGSAQEDFAKWAKTSAEEADKSITAIGNSAKAYQGLATSLMGAKDAQIVQAGIANLSQMLDDKRISPEQYSEAVKKIQISYGLADDASYAAVDALGILGGALATGVIDEEGYSKALGMVNEVAADGKVFLNEFGLEVQFDGTAAQIANPHIEYMGKTALPSVKESAEDTIPKLDLMKKSTDNSAEAMNTATKRAASFRLELIKLADQINKMPVNPEYPGPAAGGGREARASGGPVRAGGIYTVGENGPETLIMNRNGGGMVVPTTNNYNFNMTVNTQDAASPIREYNLMKAMAGAQ